MEQANDIIAIIKQADKPLALDELAVELNSDIAEVKRLCKALAQSGDVMYTRRGKIALPAWMGCVAGKLQGTRSGAAFLIPFHKEDGEGDVFIPPTALMGAMHEDTVIARITTRTPRNKAKRREGEVTQILKRARQSIVCKFEKGSASGVGIPKDDRVNQAVLIPRGKEKGAHTGDLVVVRITKWADGPRSAEGIVDEVLGEPGSAADVLAIIRHHELFDTFSKKALEQAMNVPQSVSASERAGRDDFRDLPCITIDGDDAKDYDDAISLQKLGDNFELGVHIADVSHYVKPGSPIDHDAYERATSTYFPDMVLPMLPFELSNGICSLREKEDRLSISCIMEIDREGSVVQYRFCKSVINVTRRVTYNAANGMLNHDEEQIEAFREIYPLLLDMHELSMVLTARRRGRGSLDFDLPESHIELDELGKPAAITPYERGASNLIIEEFMLAANECAAKYGTRNDLPYVYRVHEDPSDERIDELYALTEALGMPVRRPKATRIKPKALQALLSLADGQPYASVINRVVLRSMKKAKYSEKNTGHFGLALRNYCHFTSPIRRYPDLVVHRAIAASVEGGLHHKALEEWYGKMKGIALHCSERERISMEAERDVDDLNKALYMNERIGQAFTGIVSGVTEFGVFVELPSTIEGMVRIQNLPDDYYIYDETQYRLEGRHTGKTYTLGDEMAILVAGVDLSQRRIEFLPDEDIANRPAH